MSKRLGAAAGAAAAIGGWRWTDGQRPPSAICSAAEPIEPAPDQLVFGMRSIHETGRRAARAVRAGCLPAHGTRVFIEDFV